MKDLLIGLDIGTSSVKAALFDMKGQLLDHSAVPISVFTPQPGWAEQDPQEWWQAAMLALRQVLRKNNPSRVAAIGLSGQCPGHVLIDKNHQALGRAIIWQDQRAVKEATRPIPVTTRTRPENVGPKRKPARTNTRRRFQIAYPAP